MKTRFFLFFCLTISALNCFSQDSLISITRLTYKSTLERDAFSTLDKKQPYDNFTLLMANGGTMKDEAVKKAKDNFYDHLARLSQDKLQGKKNDKKVKIVFDDLHKTYLTKYELENRFESIFVNGYFNCVSATALYALAFDYLKIPYTVIEKPTHVYLIAYPDNERIIVETTAPVGGYMTISEGLKQNYVKVLKEQKIISVAEYNSIDMNTLFDRYYFGEQSNINIQQLTGLQYMNDGLYSLERENWEEAHLQFEKAYILYPSNRIAYLLTTTGTHRFLARKERDEAHATLLTKLSAYTKYGITHEMVIGEFQKTIQQLLFEQGDREKLEKYYQTLYGGLTDETLKTEIGFLYNYETGRILYNQVKIKEALPFTEKALELKPNHVDANSLFISCFARSIEGKGNAEAIDVMEKKQVAYPFLTENNLFNRMLGSAYLFAFESSYRMDDQPSGEKYRGIFENFFKAHSDIGINHYQIAGAYSAAAIYYYRKNQISKAKSLIAKGLEISPDNYELKQRQKMMQ